LAALADGPGEVANPLAARDTQLMAAALRQFGAVVDDRDPARWRVIPPARLQAGGTVDCGLAGTVLRFTPPLAALADGATRFTGDPAARARPVAPLLAALRQLGAAVAGDALPFSVAGPAAAAPSAVEFDASGSSQFVSGLLLAGARFPGGLTLRHVGPPLPSRPHIDMTVAALAARGVAVESLGPDGWRVAPGPVRACSAAVEPDLTTAAVFLAAALVARGRVTVAAWPAQSHQPGRAAPDVLVRFGGSCRLGPDGLAMAGDGRLRGADVDLRAHSELTPVVAALATLAEGRTVIRGVGHIRGHETDRLAALTREITALGGHCAETSDGLVIEPTRLSGGLWRTYGDHRMAHAGALIGLRVPGVELDDVAVVAKTMPGFADAWWGLLA
jgi:3-phosphoshikimate 1-carboxyvinyltransferase